MDSPAGAEAAGARGSIGASAVPIQRAARARHVLPPREADAARGEVPRAPAAVPGDAPAPGQRLPGLRRNLGRVEAKVRHSALRAGAASRRHRQRQAVRFADGWDPQRALPYVGEDLVALAESAEGL